MSRAFKYDIQHPVRLATCVKRLVADRFYLIANMSPCYSDHSPINSRQVVNLSANYNLLPQYGHKVVGQVSSIASQLQRNQSRTGREQVAEPV